MITFVLLISLYTYVSDPRKFQFLASIDRLNGWLNRCVWGYIGFCNYLQEFCQFLNPVTCEHDNSKTNVQNFMKLCMSLDISM